MVSNDRFATAARAQAVAVRAYHAADAHAVGKLVARLASPALVGTPAVNTLSLRSGDNLPPIHLVLLDLHHTSNCRAHLAKDVRAVAGVGYRTEAVVPARLLAKSIENRMAKQGGNDTP